MTAATRALLLTALLAALTAVGAVSTIPRGDQFDRARNLLHAVEAAGPGQVHFGVQLQWDRDDPAAYSTRTGIKPTVYGEFVEFPFAAGSLTWLGDKVEMVRSVDGIMLLTLEPIEGLDSINDTALAQLTAALRRWNAAGTPVVVRFAHEMNGAWYPWGQRPDLYVPMFRRVAEAVRASPGSRILWSPNEGGGYPFEGGRYQARAGSAAHEMLDLNQDGRVTQSDDAYAPYFPGTDHVDWVGLSLYHFGERYPWGENRVPEPGKFHAKLTGTYNGTGGDETPVPDFHEKYARRLGKPLAISETSALYNTEQAGDGDNNLAIKTAWLRQIFAPDVPGRFPALRLIMWFEQDKMESDVPAGVVQWSVTREPGLLDAFTRAQPVWLELPEA